MQKRVSGIILTVLGIVGIILAAINFLQSLTGRHNTEKIILFGIIGLIFFFAGIGLIRTARNKAT